MENTKELGCSIGVLTLDKGTSATFGVTNDLDGDDLAVLGEMIGEQLRELVVLDVGRKTGEKYQ